MSSPLRRSSSSTNNHQATKTYGLCFKSAVISAAAATAIAVTSSLAGTAHAQVGIGGGSGTGPVFPPLGDLEAKYNSYELDVLGDDIFGEHVDIDTGSTTFTQTDVSLPGNNALPVQFGRTLKADKFGQRIGGWEANIPHVVWKRVDESPYQSARCSGQLYPDDMSFSGTPQYTIRAESYFDGYSFNIPGQSTGTMAEPLAGGMSPEFAGKNAVMVSKNNWIVDCVSSIPDGGQGFRAISPTGVQYTFAGPLITEFDRDLVVPAHTSEGGSNNTQNYNNTSAETNIHKDGILVSQIRDVHGNTVDYTYDGSDRLTKIEASDGRKITFSYLSGRLHRATANGRNWTYSYSGNGKLTGLSLPDGRSWGFNVGNHVFEDGPGNCAFSNDAPPSTSMTHPSGTVGTFEFDAIKNTRTNVDIVHHTGDVPPPSVEQCFIGDHAYASATGFYSFAMIEKTFVVPGGATQVWTRDYSEDNGSYANQGSLSDTKTRILTDPVGNRTVFHVNRRNSAYLGTIEKEEVFAPGATTPIRSTTYSYDAESHVGVPMSRYYGGVTAQAQTQRVYQTTTVISQDGETFTTNNTYETNPAAAQFAYGQPSSVTTSTSADHPDAAIGNSRMTSYTYEHKTAPWVLGLTKTVSVAGEDTARYAYNSLGQKVEESAYGEVRATYGYHTSGTAKGALRWMKDAGAGHSQAFSWHRGTPRHIRQWLDDDTDGNGGRWINRYVQVDNNGWVTQRTDPNGYVFNYERDAMGRLTEIDLPGSQFSSTTVSHSFGHSGNYPVRQIVTKGDATTTVYMDARHRPVKVSQTTTGWSAVTETEYDAAGRTVFSSLPSSDIGSRTEYDALGRVSKSWTGSRTSTPASGELLTSTHYQIDNRVVTIDPAGNATYIWRDGLSGPGKGEVLYIQERQGNGSHIQRRTQMFRHITGRLTRLRQSGSLGDVWSDKSHHFAYDSRKRLCRYRIPEAGATLYDYDSRGVVTRYSKGNAINANCGSMSGSNVVNVDTDSLYRQIRVDFADGNTLDMDYLFDDSGSMLRTKRGQLSGSTMTAVDNELHRSYDELGNVATESQRNAGFSIDFDHFYGYDNNGFMNYRRNPAGIELSWTNDGFGHQQDLATTDGSYSYATGIDYHEDGSLADYVAGNGQTFTRSVDHLFRTQALQSIGGNGFKALDLTYGYDSRSLIASILDNSTAGINASGKDHSVSNITYDGLGQLKTADGWWGAGSFKYDSVGNIRGRTLGSSRTITNSYNSSNELSQVVDSLTPTNGGTGTRAVGHDTRGNVTSLGALSMAYDHSDQMVSVTTSGMHTGLDGNPIQANGSYAYNGEKKRVRSVVNGRRTLFVYDFRGKLSYSHKEADGEGTSKIYLESGQLLATKTDSKVTFMHQDHLGTPIRGTKGPGHSGTLGTEEFQEFSTPFGLQPTNGWFGRGNSGVDGSQGYGKGLSSTAGVTGFTDHIFDVETGIIHMQARNYDPASGRFLSQDPVTAMSMRDIRYFNRYSYTFNNPVSNTDPTGMCVNAPISCPIGSFDGAITEGHGTVSDGALYVIGAAIVVFDVATVPSGEGLAGVALIRAAAASVGKDAAVGAGVSAAIETGIQLEENDLDFSSLDGKAVLGAAKDGSVPGVLGGAGGRQLDKVGKAISRADKSSLGEGAFERGTEKVARSITENMGTVGATIGGVVPALTEERQPPQPSKEQE